MKGQADPVRRVPANRVPANRVLAGLASAAVVSACGTEARPPSVVLFSVDTLSARHLSLYGYERPTSPFLDELAREAVVFDHCLANAPWTGPSYMSQLTGLYPLALRVEPTDEAPGPLHWFLHPERHTLAEHLSAAGYRTAAFVDNPYLQRELGFAQGFDVFDASAAEIGLSNPEGGVRHVLPRVVDWLATVGPDEPFFLFVNVLDVHGPYLPAEPFRGRFADGAEQTAGDAPVAAAEGTIHEAIPHYVLPPPARAEDGPKRLPTAPFVAAYDEQVLTVDRHLERLVEELEALERFDDCVFVVSADHGEGFGDHGTYFCHQTVYLDDLHVPLVMRLPGGRGAGRRVAERVQLVDLMPTLAELVGLPLGPSSVHGRSLGPLLDGRRSEPVPLVGEVPLLEAQTVVYDGWKLVRSRLGLDTASVTAVLSHPRVRRWVAQRFPQYADEVYGSRGFPEAAFRRDVLAELRADASLLDVHYELYHLDEDPLEERDLAAREPERVARLRHLLDAERERARGRQLAGGAYRPTPDLLEEMRALGYLDTPQGGG